MSFTKFILTALLSLLQLFLQAQTTETTQQGVNITVKVTNIRDDKGKVLFGLYDSQENFDQRIAFSGAIGKISDFKTEVVFENVPPGTYAIICFHDQNDNNQLDFDNLMPTEDYGATNNSKIFGPPQFNASKFEVTDANLTFEIFF